MRGFYINKKCSTCDRCDECLKGSGSYMTNEGGEYETLEDMLKRFGPWKEEMDCWHPPRTILIRDESEEI